MTRSLVIAMQIAAVFFSLLPGVAAASPFELARALVAQAFTRSRPAIVYEQLAARNAPFYSLLSRESATELNFQGWTYVGARGGDHLLVKAQSLRTSARVSANPVRAGLNEGVFFPTERGAILFRVSGDGSAANAAHLRFVDIAKREFAEAGIDGAEHIRPLWTSNLDSAAGESRSFVDVAINTDHLDPATLERILAHFAP